MYLPAGQGALGGQVATETRHLQDECLSRFRPSLDAYAVFAEHLKWIGADHELTEADNPAKVLEAMQEEG